MCDNFQYITLIVRVHVMSARLWLRHINIAIYDNDVTYNTNKVSVLQ